LTDLNGKTYEDLPGIYQRRIEEADIILYRIEPGTPDRVKFDIFRRINTGGEPLTSQEIRHALNQGTSTSFLKRLAGLDEFKRATSNSIAPTRMDDRECVLRYLAFMTTPPSEYKNQDFDKFLNEYMQEFNRKFQTYSLAESESLLFEIEKKFKETMNLAYELFDNDAFRKRYESDADRKLVSKALFEAWSVNLANLTDQERDILQGRKNELRNNFIELMNNNKEFENSISQGTGSVKRVRIRFSEIRRIIKETISC